MASYGSRPSSSQQQQQQRQSQTRRDAPQRSIPSTAAERQPSINSVVSNTRNRPAANSTYASRQQQNKSNTPTPRGPSPLLRVINFTDDESDLDGFDSSDDDFDIFYTPNQSPRTSMASSIKFPSKPRNPMGPLAAPRMATRKSLRTSNTPTIASSSAAAPTSVSNSVPKPDVTTSRVPNSTPVPTSQGQQQPPRSNVHTVPANPKQATSPPASTSRAEAPSKQAVPSTPKNADISSKQAVPSTPKNADNSSRQSTSSTSKNAVATPQQQTRKPVPSTSTPPSSQSRSTQSTRPQPESTTPSQSSTLTRTPTTRTVASDRTDRTDRTNDSNLTKATSTPIRSPSLSSSNRPSPPSTTNKPPPALNRKHPLSIASSTLSFSSTSLDNHSDLFSTSGSDSTNQQQLPLNGKPNLTAGRDGAAPSTSTPRGSVSGTKVTKTPISTAFPNPTNVNKVPVPSANQVPIQNQNQNQAARNRYSYTDDDWAKDIRWLVNNPNVITGDASFGSISLGGSEPKLTQEEEVPTVTVERSSSSASKVKGKEREKLKDADEKDKGPTKEKEKDKGKEKKDKSKSKRKSGSTEREVVYYTATHGTPRVPPPPTIDIDAGVGTSNPIGVGSKNTRTLLPPPGLAQAPALPPKLPPKPANRQNRNSFNHLHAPSMLASMSALMEEDEMSDGRLSVVTERDEGGNSILGRTSTARGSITNSLAVQQPLTQRRRSRSLGDHQDLIQEVPRGESELEPREISVTSWATDYKDILARTRESGNGYANGSLFSSPSQHSFAYRSAVPVPTGELPSHGTPGYTSLHLARAPPPLASPTNGTSHRRSNSRGFLSGFINSMSGSGSGGGSIDLTKSGIAQTTMASIEVVRGLGGQSVRKSGLGGVLSSLARRRTVSGGDVSQDRSRSYYHSRFRKRSEDIYHFTTVGRNPNTTVADASTNGIAHDVRNDGVADPRALAMSTISAERILGFTGYRRPPNYVPSGSVIVQVWAVGLDSVDGKLVGVRLGLKRAGVDAQQNHNHGLAGEGDRVEQDQEQGEQQQDQGQRLEQQAGADRDRGRRKMGRSVSLRSRLGSLSRRKGSLSLSRGWRRDKEKEKEKEREKEREGTENERSGVDEFGRAPTRGRDKDKALPPPPISQADVGFIPGRSFVGRVLECGWEVKEDTVRKGEWVVGLLDAKKCGALTEFIVVDRHRIQRVPYPASLSDPQQSTSTSTSSSGHTAKAHPVPAGVPAQSPAPTPPLTLEELALLPLCGVAAYRAVRTFSYTFSKHSDSGRHFDYSVAMGPHAHASTAIAGAFIGGRQHLFSDHEPERRRRALVLRGHDGVGAMAVQMLALRGWRVSVHVSVPGSHELDEVQQYMAEVENRVRVLGGEEVVFDDGGMADDPWWDDGRAAVVRVIDGLREDGDVFDAVLDTIGGKQIREASERLLRSNGKDGEGEVVMENGNGSGVVSLDGQTPPGRGVRRTGNGQFTTLVGDVTERAIPTAADNFRAGLRSLKFGSGGSGSYGSGSRGGGYDHHDGNGGSGGGGASGSGGSKGKGKVGYAWISVTQDVDWEGDGIAESIGNVLRLALEHGIKPVVPRVSATTQSPLAQRWKSGVIPFDKTPEIFVDGDGPLCNGGTMVVKVATK